MLTKYAELRLADMHCLTACGRCRLATQPTTSKISARRLSARALILEQLKADAARTTACLEGTAFLERNRAAFEKSLKARATATATARAAAEARLSHSKRVDRSSIFVSDATDRAPTAQYASFLSPACVASRNRIFLPLMQRIEQAKKLITKCPPS